jgi:iron complex outermembrane receptor protein
MLVLSNKPLIAWVVLGLFGAVSAHAQSLPGEGGDSRAQPMEEIEVRAQRLNDLEQRRYTNSVKTVVGREEIQKYGDSSLEDVLRRQPGVSIAAGGGSPRLRGMQGAYTQILIDGQPAGRGFTIDSIAPDQVERIEILRVPTAETGSQAVAGSVNIVTREGLARGRRDLGMGISLGEGNLQGFRLGLTQQGGWAGEESMVSLTLFGQSQSTSAEQSIRFIPVSAPLTNNGQSTVVFTAQDRLGLSLRGQTNRALSNAGSITVRPLFFAVRGETRSDTTVGAWQGERPTGFVSPSNREDAQQGSDYVFGRVLLLYKRPVKPNVVFEAGVTPSVYVLQRRSNSVAQGDDLSNLRRQTDSETREQALLASAKIKRFLANDEQTLGFELETTQQDEQETLRVNGRMTETGWGGRLDQYRTRWAVYGQWDWNPKSQWAVLGGLRHEEMHTELKTFGGLLRDENTSAQTSPSVSLVFRPDAMPNLLYRWSVSHAYKPARPQDLLSAPRVSSRYPLDASNTPESADFVGNPQLQPEQSWGVDFSLENSPGANSLLSAGVFWKKIIDLQRRVTELEAVSWSDGPRWVSRPRNLGQADLVGLELEAKGPAALWSQWLAPKVVSVSGLDLRASWSRYWSQLNDVDGPDNRLPGQPVWEAKLGMDARPPKSALRYGASLSYTRAGRYQTEPNAWAFDGNRLWLEAYGVYTLDQGRRLRVSLQDIARSETQTYSVRRFEEGDRINTERRAGRLRLMVRYEHSM